MIITEQFGKNGMTFPLVISKGNYTYLIREDAGTHLRVLRMFSKSVVKTVIDPRYIKLLAYPKGVKKRECKCVNCFWKSLITEF